MVRVRFDFANLAASSISDVHLRACLDEPDDVGVWACADVLYCIRPATTGQLSTVLQEFPGCMVCAAPTGGGGTSLALRSAGAHLLVLPDTGGWPHLDISCADLASVAHGLLICQRTVRPSALAQISGLIPVLIAVLACNQ